MGFDRAYAVRDQKDVPVSGGQNRHGTLPSQPVERWAAEGYGQYLRLFQHAAAKDPTKHP